MICDNCRALNIGLFPDIHWVMARQGVIICEIYYFSYQIAQASATVNSSTSHHRSSTSGTGDLRIQRPKAVQRSKSLAIEDFVEEIQWMRLRIIDLETVDNLPPLPMHITWVRGGILIVGLDNEIHVYTQWRGPAFVIPVSGQTSAAGDCDENESSLHLTHDKHTLSEANLASISCDKAMTKSCMSMSNISALATSIKPGRSVLSSVEMSQCLDACVKPARDMVSRLSLERCDGAGRLNSVCDFGLFEAVRLANPVLPQYHPEQLKVLLGLGKIRRVKVILVHLLNCIVGSDSMQVTCGVFCVNVGARHNTDIVRVMLTFCVTLVCLLQQEIMGFFSLSAYVRNLAHGCEKGNTYGTSCDFFRTSHCPSYVFEQQTVSVNYALLEVENCCGQQLIF